MSDLEKILFVIPARGGSKRLKRKNILPLGDKPLLCWSIEAALKLNCNAKIVVTSDDDALLGIAEHYAKDGVESHKRPHDLGSDTATMVSVVKDAIKAMQDKGFDAQTVVLLQPTSPLRNAEDIQAAIELFEEKGGVNTVVTVTELEHPSAWNGYVNNNGEFEGVDLSGKRSQDYTSEYRLNGAVYVIFSEEIIQRDRILTERIFASIMPRARSIDIDSEIDMMFADFFLKNNIEGSKFKEKNVKESDVKKMMLTK